MKRILFTFEVPTDFVRHRFTYDAPAEAPTSEAIRAGRDALRAEHPDAFGIQRHAVHTLVPPAHNLPPVESGTEGGADTPAGPTHPPVSSPPHPLRQEREERGWSIDELARRSGVSERTIHAIERGERRSVLQTTKRKLLRALDLSFGQRTRIFDNN
jgi:DNA-binding XRE family transcriptional regulator